MRAVPYHEPSCDYRDYYLKQVGNGFHLPVYGGARIQRGSGLGNIFSGLWRAAVPLLKRGAKAVGKRAVRTGIRVAGDVLRGRNMKTSLKRRGAEALDSFLGAPAKKSRKTSNKRPRRRRRRVVIRKGKRRDVFS